MDKLPAPYDIRNIDLPAFKIQNNSINKYGIVNLKLEDHISGYSTNIAAKQLKFWNSNCLKYPLKSYLSNRKFLSQIIRKLNLKRYEFVEGGISERSEEKGKE